MRSERRFTLVKVPPAPHVTRTFMLTPAPPPAHAAPHGGRSASELLEDLVEAFPGDSVSVGELIDRLDSRAHGVLLLVLALPMCIPNIPGISTIFGMLMMFPAVQLMLGWRRLWVPQRARVWRVDCAALRRTFRVATPPLKRIEYLIKPRWSELTRFPFTIFVGFQTLLMALILILPVFGANLPPGFTVVVTALALLQRDGLLMLLSTPLAVGSVAALIYFGYLSLTVISSITDWVMGLF
jgi:hypothetical protein